MDKEAKRREKQKKRNERIAISNATRKWDNAAVSAQFECDYAWKCVKCGKLHVAHGLFQQRQEYSNITYNEAAQRMREELPQCIGQLNSGSAFSLPFDGQCEACGELQAWGRLAVKAGILKPHKVRRGLGYTAAVILIILGSSVLLSFVLLVAQNWKACLLLPAGGVMIAIAVLLIRKLNRRIDAETASVSRYWQNLKMAAQEHPGCFPLISTGNDFDNLSGDDERVLALQALSSAYKPNFKCIVYDNDTSD